MSIHATFLYRGILSWISVAITCNYLFYAIYGDSFGTVRLSVRNVVEKQVHNIPLLSSGILHTSSVDTAPLHSLSTLVQIETQLNEQMLSYRISSCSQFNLIASLMTLSHNIFKTRFKSSTTKF